MNRQLHLVNSIWSNFRDYSSYNVLDCRQFVCAGDSCELCQLRFQCFTELPDTIFEIDWGTLHNKYEGNPTAKLKALTGSKAYRAMSKKYVEIVETLVNYQWSSDVSQQPTPRLRVMI